MISSNAYSIRTANTTDFTALLALFERVRLGAGWLPQSAERADRSTFGLSTQGERIEVAEDGLGTLIGFVSVYVPESFIHHLYIDTTLQRSGVGRALLASLEGWLPRPWHLKCVAANQQAFTFYRKLGWTVQGRGEGPEGPWLLLQY